MRWPGEGNKPLCLTSDFVFVLFCFALTNTTLKHTPSDYLLSFLSAQGQPQPPCNTLFFTLASSLSPDQKLCRADNQTGFLSLTSEYRTVLSNSNSNNNIIITTKTISSDFMSYNLILSITLQGKKYYPHLIGEQRDRKVLRSCSRSRSCKWQSWG